MIQKLFFAGSGGQGVILMGQMIAYASMYENKEVTFLPSYGPEMRGGTANCSVCISDEPIGSPLVLHPELLIAMNNPSYDKFIDTVPAGGIAVLDSALVDRKCQRTDIKVCYVPATTLANEQNLQSLANIILVGKLLKESGFSTVEAVEKAVSKCVPPKKAHLIEANNRAIQLGMSL